MNEQKVTDEQIIEALETMSHSQAAKHLGLHARTLSKRKARMAGAGLIASTVPEVRTIESVSAQCYVITAAVNATKAHSAFLKTL